MDNLYLSSAILSPPDFLSSPQNLQKSMIFEIKKNSVHFSLSMILGRQKFAEFFERFNESVYMCILMHMFIINVYY